MNTFASLDMQIVRLLFLDFFDVFRHSRNVFQGRFSKDLTGVLDFLQDAHTSSASKDAKDVRRAEDQKAGGSDQKG